MSVLSVSIMTSLQLLGFIAPLVTTTTSSGSGDGDRDLYPLKMTAVMLHHNLSWPPPEVQKLTESTMLYNVWYENMDTNRRWFILPNCENIASAHCNIDDDGPFPFTEDFDYSFFVEGHAPGSKEIVYRTNQIIFNAFREMNLVPPFITMGIYDNGFFLKPERQYLWDRSPIEKVDSLAGIVYQIEYWRGNDTDDVQTATTATLDREISIPVEHSNEYCARIRLYIEKAGRITQRTVFSNWSAPPVCASQQKLTHDNVNPSTSQETVKYICIGIACLVAIVILPYFTYKIRKIHRIFNEKVLPPDVLMTIFQNSTEPCRNSQEREMIDFMALEVADAFSPQPSLQRNSYDDFQLASESEPIASTTAMPLLHLDDDNVFDEYLQYPVFDDETALSVNMPHGIENACDREEENMLGDSQNSLLRGISFYERMDIPQPLLPVASCHAESVKTFEIDALHSIRPRRLPTVSDRSSGSDTSLMFDIKSSINPATSNFYIGRNPEKGGSSATEGLNIAYSSNPKRDVPDVLFCDYTNEL